MSEIIKSYCILSIIWNKCNLLISSKDSLYFCHSGNDNEMRELEAVLCYDQNLKHIVLSMFCLENSEYFLKIKGLDPVSLLQRTLDMIDTFATHHDKVSIHDSSLYAI